MTFTPMRCWHFAFPHREQFKEATEEAQQAIHLAPDAPFSHYALAKVLHERNRDDAALPVINEALRLDASEPGYFALLAAIQLGERHWPAALEAAEQGLRRDSEHTACTNLRAIALVKLGRKAEAGLTIDAALARNPDDSVTHANQGWTLLEKGDSKKALEHFRESLRPSIRTMSGRARESSKPLKARNIIYAAMLKYFLFMGKLSPRAQWGVILGGYFGSRALYAAGKANPGLEPWVLPIQILYVGFVLMSWIADPFFNLMLRLNRFGRLALPREKIIASNWLGLCLLLALLSLAGCLVFGFNRPCLLAALNLGALLVPVAGTFKCPIGWPRNGMAIYTGLLACVGIIAISLFALSEGRINSPSDDPAWVMISVVLIGAFGSSWIANILIAQRRRR